MMYSTTVARIVDMMFENTEMTEEVAALREEVMNNCQERYQDMINAGVYEEDAIAAVVESLKGMEDVISQYKRKGRRSAMYSMPQVEMPIEPQVEEPTVTWSAEAENVNASGERDMTFNPAEIHRIDLTLVSEDVEVEESTDGLCHVRWDCDGDETIACRAQNGVIRIERIPGRKPDGRHAHVNIDNSGNGAHVYVNGEEMDMSDTASIMEKVGRVMGRIFGSMKGAFNYCDTVTIAVPAGMKPHMKLITTSGDVSVMQVELLDLDMTTVSGDLEVQLDKDAPLARLSARSTSGDITVNAYAQQVMLASTSGDVDVEGCVTELNANTVSGDIDVNADVERVEFKAISGDVDLAFHNDVIRNISGSTISGDIDVDLPSGIGAIAINTHTRSGDMTTRYSTSSFGPTVSGSITSMSGDITIR